jgi:hypothetical protein
MDTSNREAGGRHLRTRTQFGTIERFTLHEAPCPREEASRSARNPCGGGAVEASTGVEKTLIDEDAEGSVGQGEYGGPDPTGVEVDDIGGD